jgi:hypothetical protein
VHLYQPNSDRHSCVVICLAAPPQVELLSDNAVSEVPEQASTPTPNLPDEDVRNSELAVLSQLDQDTEAHTWTVFTVKHEWYGYGDDGRLQTFWNVETKKLDISGCDQPLALGSQKEISVVCKGLQLTQGAHSHRTIDQVCPLQKARDLHWKEDKSARRVVAAMGKPGLCIMVERPGHDRISY